MKAIEHQLQINDSGAWKTLARWPRNDDALASNARNAARFLYSCNARAKFRVITSDPSPRVLRVLDKASGGRWRGVERAA